MKIVELNPRLEEVPVEALDAQWEASVRAAPRNVQDGLLAQADRLRVGADDAASWRCLTVYRVLVERLEGGTREDLERAAWTTREDPARDGVTRRLVVLALRHPSRQVRYDAECAQAECEIRAGQLPEAERRLRRILPLVRGSGDLQELNVCHALAVAFALQQRELESLLLARCAWQVAESRPELHVVHVAQAATALTWAYRSLEDHVRLVDSAREMLAAAERMSEPDAGRLRMYTQMELFEGALLRDDLPAARRHLELAQNERRRDPHITGHIPTQLPLHEVRLALREGRLDDAGALLGQPDPEERRRRVTWIAWDVTEVEWMLRTGRQGAGVARARTILARMETPAERSVLGTSRRLRWAETIGALLTGRDGDPDLATSAYRLAADAAYDRLLELERCGDELPELSSAPPDDRAALAEYRKRFVKRHSVLLEHLRGLLAESARHGSLPAWASTAPGGLTAICAWCRSVRGSDGRWLPLGHFLYGAPGLTVTHGICDRCVPVVGSVKRA